MSTVIGTIYITVACFTWVLSNVFSNWWDWVVANKESSVPKSDDGHDAWVEYNIGLLIACGFWPVILAILLIGTIYRLKHPVKQERRYNFTPPKKPKHYLEEKYRDDPEPEPEPEPYYEKWLASDIRGYVERFFFRHDKNEWPTIDRISLQGS